MAIRKTIMVVKSHYTGKKSMVDMFRGVLENQILSNLNTIEINDENMKKGLKTGEECEIIKTSNLLPLTEAPC